jgi:phage terminase large subunit GpA-like protein
VLAVPAAADQLADTWATLRPPPRLTLSAWADEHFRLSAGSADAGRWRTRPYQRAILDAITDPAVERVSVIKSARIGWTQMMGAAIGYFMTQDPCPILVVQPTVETAEIYSREMVAPMLRDVPALADLMKGSAVKTSGRTLLHKTFPGGAFSMVGANSGAGLAMISRRVVALDEVDRYPASAGDEGDPVSLAEKRSESYWNRKIIAGSTPKLAGASRIEEMFLAGDQRRFYVPCPQCGHMDFLAFRPRPDGRGHVMQWDDGAPESAYFVCRVNECIIEETSKRAMLDAGEWRADGMFAGHASFHIWTAYSTSPNVSWGEIVAEFLAVKDKTEQLKTFVNTTLGETWQDHGDATQWEQLYQRREPYTIGTVPSPSIVALTCGVDVQKDRFVYEVVGWAANRENWSIDYGELDGDTAIDATWNKLDERLLTRTFPGIDGAQHVIAMLAIDSGAFTQSVYDWARRHPMSQVIAIKGDDGPRPIIGAASKVDINFRGKRLQRGYRVFVVGSDTAKVELAGWLGMPRGEGDPPAGWCHFPEHDPKYFKQLTAEHLVTVVNRKTNRSTREWRVIANRENHVLDCRVYARAAAALIGIERMAQPPKISPAQATAAQAPGSTPAPPLEQPRAESRPSSGYWGPSRGYWDRRR